MQQLNELNSVVGECNRIVDGMLNGKMSRDDGLFAAAATLRNIAIEFVQFVTYALPILHTIDQAMRAAQAQAAQMQTAQAQAARMEDPSMARDARTRAQEAPQSPQTPTPQEAPPANVVPINAGGDIQVVDGTPGGRR